MRILTSYLIFLHSFFQDGIKVVDNLKPFMEKLATDLTAVCYLILLSNLLKVYFFLFKTKTIYFCYYLCVNCRTSRHKMQKGNS